MVSGRLVIGPDCVFRTTYLCRSRKKLVSMPRSPFINKTHNMESQGLNSPTKKRRRTTCVTCSCLLTDWRRCNACWSWCNKTECHPQKHICWGSGQLNFGHRGSQCVICIRTAFSYISIFDFVDTNQCNQRETLNQTRLCVEPSCFLFLSELVLFAHLAEAIGRGWHVLLAVSHNPPFSTSVTAKLVMRQTARNEHRTSLSSSALLNVCSWLPSLMLSDSKLVSRRCLGGNTKMLTFSVWFDVGASIRRDKAQRKRVSQAARQISGMLDVSVSFPALSFLLSWLFCSVCNLQLCFPVRSQTDLGVHFVEQSCM